jgi:3-oxoacyl-(acyl-carrier-protein) synthase
MQQVLQLETRLSMREQVAARELDLALDTRAKMHTSGVPYTPFYPHDRLFPGTYYLTHIDAQWRRHYARTPVGPMTPWDGVVRPLQPAPSIRSFADETDLSACYITGTAAGLPGQEQVFRADNLERLLKGENCISAVDVKVQQSMLDKNIILLKKNPDQTAHKIPLTETTDMIQLAAQLGAFDLTERYGVPSGLAKTMDVAAQVAVAAGLEALKNAGLVSGRSSDSSEWKLPEALQADTGVVYASSFPAMDAAIGEVVRYFSSSTPKDNHQLIQALRQRMLDVQGTLSSEDEDALAHLKQQAAMTNGHKTTTRYAFDRKFLFRVLVLGNAQLAQLAGCKGPNTQTNAACAGTTQAISMAHDMLVAGRAARVVVIAGDNAAGPTLLPWLGSGFRVLGAATCKSTVEEAALPFDKRRSGMLLGAGGIGLVLETAPSIRLRQLSTLPCVRLLATQYSNSAFHGAALDRHHIGSELVRFLNDIQKRFGITKTQIATEGVYFSHETCTHASDASSCAGNEVAALRQAFGDDLPKLLIVNTKGYTGHPMGVSFEDVAAVAVLHHQQVPAMPNYRVHDEYLGDLNLSKGGPYSCKFALRFAAGFGSQVAFALYAKV